jgi:tetratricopeptide (TPR) repeat protein
MFTSKNRTVRSALTVFMLCGTLALTGCAGSISRWIVNTRVHQGELALEHGNVRDAELAYQLALKVDPKDERARAGFVSAAAALALSEYTRGQFDDALATISEGLKYDPSSVRLTSLKQVIDTARLNREIVISNYPTYHEAGLQLARAYQQLNITNKEILKDLNRFSYTFDTADLSKAIKQSYTLQLDVAKNTNRLIAYRDVVNSGVPATGHEETSSSAASLLPLP